MLPAYSDEIQNHIKEHGEIVKAIEIDEENKKEWLD